MPITGLDLMYPPVVYSHFLVPLLLSKAKSLLPLEPTKIVPSIPIEGELLTGDPVLNSQILVPVSPFRANILLSAVPELCDPT